MFSGLTEEARSKAHSWVQTHLEACGQSLHWNLLYPPSRSEPRSGGAGGSRWAPLLSTSAVPSPDWVHGTLLRGPLFGPGGQGAPPSHRQGWSRRPQEDHAHAGRQLLRSFGSLLWLALEGRNRRPEVVLPERGLGVSPRPCRTRSPAPQLRGHLKAPFSFLLCKSPNFLISCFAPSNGTCHYVTSIIKIPPSKRHCALHEAGQGKL